MPVEFLTDEEAAAYGSYQGVPSRAEMEKLFFLDAEDKQLIAKRRGDHSRLGFSLQLTTVRYLGLFLPDPLAVPAEVVAYLAEQLEISDPECVGRYTERRTTKFEHADEIKAKFGLVDFEAKEKELREWVDARSRTTGDGPKAIFLDAVRSCLDSLGMDASRRRGAWLIGCCLGPGGAGAWFSRRRAAR